jgi:KUP system potassium uptake protein
MTNPAHDSSVLQSAPAHADEPEHHHAPPARGRYLALLSLTALGIAYGDIGTSPLYAIRESFHGPHAIPTTPTNVMGVLSLIFWSLILVISIKYLVFVLRADNRGEGGILALTSLATPIKRFSESQRKWIVILGVFGAALLYGDGIITPAISVLSAVEGLQIATPFFQPYVIPITVLIIVGLFLIQRHGTGMVGRFFGPITLLWFIVLGVLGVVQIVTYPAVLGAVNPMYSVAFFREAGTEAFFILGTVVLVVTGGEALYADMGHFGRLPIRLAWFVVALPALLLNYMGQAALLIRNPASAENPFYRMAPSWALYPLVVLATMATVIASQALISGAFSITMQATQLGLLPRIRILHTSRTERGQIYIPGVNWLLMAACIAVVVSFRTSSNLAAAYGTAVTSAMVITAVIFFVVARERWGWSLLRAGSLAGFFLLIDLAFLAANSVKIPGGGWFTLAVALLIFVVMTTWKRGETLVAQRASSDQMLNQVTDMLQTKPPVRVPGTAIFLSARAEGAPEALLANIHHNGVLHQYVLLVTVQNRPIPHVEPSERLALTPIGHGLYTLTVSYGFMETPDVHEAICALEIPEVPFDPNEVTYFINRTRVIPTKLPGMALWREKLFALMSSNATNAADFFSLPPAQVIEIGTRVEV